jgi:hypothetical protein
MEFTRYLTIYYNCQEWFNRYDKAYDESKETSQLEKKENDKWKRDIENNKKK